MYELEIPERVWRQIDEVKRYTEERFGPVKRWEYEDLIAEALLAIESDPWIGKSRSAARPDTLAYHIKQRGRNARHLFFYRVIGNVIQVMSFLHDSMDFDRTSPSGSSHRDSAPPQFPGGQTSVARHSGPLARSTVQQRDVPAQHTVPQQNSAFAQVRKTEQGACSHVPSLQ
jgi:plasmid stabilization system protein ParE